MRKGAQLGFALIVATTLWMVRRESLQGEHSAWLPRSGPAPPPLNLRPHPSGLTIALAIPATRRHVELFLEHSLLRYLQGTVWPDEVLISAAQADEIDPFILASLRARYSHIFPRFELLAHSGKRSSGFNRNEAGQLARSDIVIFADADDPPHPQRLEVLTTLFEKKPELLMAHHHWSCNSSRFAPLNASRLSDPSVLVDVDELSAAHAAALLDAGLAGPFPPSERLLFDDFPVYGTHLEGERGTFMLTGQPALRRSVLSAGFRFPDFHGGEDKVFSWNVVGRLGRSVVLTDELACYSSREACSCPVLAPLHDGRSVDGLLGPLARDGWLVWSIRALRLAAAVFAVLAFRAWRESPDHGVDPSYSRVLASSESAS